MFLDLIFTLIPLEIKSLLFAVAWLSQVDVLVIKLFLLSSKLSIPYFALWCWDWDLTNHISACQLFSFRLCSCRVLERDARLEEEKGHASSCLFLWHFQLNSCFYESHPNLTSNPRSCSLLVPMLLYSKLQTQFAVFPTLAEQFHHVPSRDTSIPP